MCNGVGYGKGDEGSEDDHSVYTDVQGEAWR